MSVRNRILAALSANDFDRICTGLELVSLEFRQVLMEPHRTIEYVHFPEDLVVSVLGLMDDGSAVETATVGNEGMAGVPVYLGAMQMAGHSFVQIAGNAYRMPASASREEVRRGSELAQILGRYVQALFTLVAQSSACNRKHSTEQRCARWLLMTHDRVGADEFPLTHEFLSHMLGVRRASVTLAMQILKRAGVIDYARGIVTVLDRAGLEEAACECYRIVRDEYDRLLTSPPWHAP